MTDNNELMIKIDNVVKQYKLGEIGGTTLRDELQRLGARIKHKEDPTKKIGAKDYNKGEIFRALNGVSFEVKKGERVGIIGHNGAGKSTLLKLISRVTTPTQGEIGLNGRITSMLEVGTGFHGELTGRENIYMNGAILGMTKKEIDAKMEDIIEFSECRQFIDTPVKRYSSGMYVKLAFSVAAHLDSEIMIMDEVLAVGDMAFQKKCLDKMNDVSREQGRTILYVSHNMNTIRQLCDRVVVLNHGKVVFDGNVDEGIHIYLEGKTEISCHVNLDDKEREKWAHTDKVKMCMFNVADREKPIYNVGEKIDAVLQCHIFESVTNVQIRFEIKDMNFTPVATSATLKGIDFQKGTDANIHFVFDSSKIVPGKYTMGIVLYIPEGNGRYIDLDGMPYVFSFEIHAPSSYNHYLPWKSNLWGYWFEENIQYDVLALKPLE